MKHRFLLLLVMILILIAIAGSISPDEKVSAIGSAEIRKSVLASSGGRSEGGEVQINATLGQAVAGSAQVDGTTLLSGFWTWIKETVNEFLNFLPLMLH